MVKWAYKFCEGSAATRNLLGGKGYSLAEVTNLGVSVPQEFTVAAEACIGHYNYGKQISQEIQDQIFEAITQLGGVNGKKFGDTEDPLLASVRPDTRTSMPGMMDTILSLGLNDAAVEGFTKKTGNPGFAYNSHRKLIQMYPNIAMEVPESYPEKITGEMEEAKGVHLGTDLTADDLKELAIKFKAVYKDAMDDEEFPQNSTEQLMGAIRAVFHPWDNPRVIVHRRMNDIPGNWGIAVNVQTMVFGNKGETFGIGVAFTRNPSTGAGGIYGEYLINTQSEGVVAGVRALQPTSKLTEGLPECYKKLMDLTIKPEDHSHNMQDMEFTIEEGKLYFLQTHNGKRIAPAAIQIAYDLVDRGVITPEEAAYRIKAKPLGQLLHPIFVPEALKVGEVIGSTLPTSPGAVVNKIYFTADEVRGTGKNGRDERVILVCLETSPEDIEGMHAARGALTIRGGMTSHAAVVARGMGTCCVSGCGEIKTDEEAKVFEFGGHTFYEGDYILLDGSTGKIYKGGIATQEAAVSGNFERIMEWVDQLRVLCVRTSADTPTDTLNTVKLGIEGIDLCHTEYTFFDVERTSKIRKMILSETVGQREEALNKLIPFQRGDFKAMYKALEGKPVTVRYLDPPLREFVPTNPEDIKAPADDMGVIVEAINVKYVELHEFNPMMGHRRCRLAATYSEIVKMQARAITEVAIEVKEECGYDIVPEIMIPLVGGKKELKYVKDVVVEIAELAKKEKNSDIQYRIGTMIEIPRTTLTADRVAEEADFFSFKTNDLTQIALSFLRDDADKFLNSCYRAKTYESDPFARLDQEGVGQLAKMAVEKGRPTKADLECGICGERGGDPSSAEFCYKIESNYVSCSPFRVPVTCLAMAQAALSNKQAAIYPIENDSCSYQCFEILCGQAEEN